MSLKIERWPWQRMGLGRTKFDEDFVLKDERDPYVPNTNDEVKRLRSVPLSERCRGFFSDEVDTLIEAVRALRNSKPFAPPREPPQLIKSKRKRTQQSVRS